MPNAISVENATAYTLVHNMGWDAKDAAMAVREYVAEEGEGADPEVEYVYEAIMDGRINTIGLEEYNDSSRNS